MRKKKFRVECGPAEDEGTAAAIAVPVADDHALVAELKALRGLLEQSKPPAIPAIDPQQLAEFHKLRSELDIIHTAINRTKQEIATLHVTGFRGPEMARVTDELGAVVGGTEQATETILAAAEEIDQSANTLSAGLKSEHERGLTQDIQDRVVKIFEACNFQDLTGQRIGKVAATLKFIEQHIERMIEIWGGIEALRDFQPEAMTTRNADAMLLNGPKLDGDTGHVSQNDIDALFN